MARMSWSEKMASGHREVKPAPKDFADIKAGQTMLLPTARDVADVVRTLRKGRPMDIKGLRAALARKHKADIACPVVTGIQLRVVAEVAGEQLDAGIPAAKVAPVWRVLGPKSPSWKKLENGRARFEALRRAEKLAD
jgi:hypothetical protein